MGPRYGTVGDLSDAQVLTAAKKLYKDVHFDFKDEGEDGEDGEQDERGRDKALEVLRVGCGLCSRLFVSFMNHLHLPQTHIYPFTRTFIISLLLATTTRLTAKESRARQGPQDAWC